MTRKQKKAAASRYTFVLVSFHLSAAAMAGVAHGSVPPCSLPSREAAPDDARFEMFCFVGAGVIGSSSMADIVAVTDMIVF
jgi:hypothetical protein